MAKRFADRVVIVTGASSPIGIGAAAAQQFAEEGASVALVARGEGGLRDVARRIEARSGKVRAFPADLRDRKACDRVLQQTADAFGGIDVLVNNAGVNFRGPVEARDAEELASIVSVNLIVPILMTRLVLPYLRARGGGSIVQVASIAGQFPLPDEATYSASKYGLRGFSFALREELRDSSIRVSVVSPGPVDTGFLRENLDSVPNLVFANPMSSPEAVAQQVLECAADGRRERTIPVQTGWLARAGAAAPGLRRMLMPVLERRGKSAKEAFRHRHGL
jgi:short-subunit dehydrogenase